MAHFTGFTKNEGMVVTPLEYGAFDGQVELASASAILYDRLVFHF